MNPEPPSHHVIIAFLLLVVAIGGGGILLVTSRPDPVEIVINPPIPTPTPGPIFVYITGAVINPQTILELPMNSRVQDVLTAAGGPAANADMDRVNLAGIVRDGDHIHVYAIGEMEQVSLPAAQGANLINVNQASASQLEALPGIGPALARRIVDYRAANGPFSSLESLDAISGIGPSILENIAGFIFFE